MIRYLERCISKVNQHSSPEAGILLLDRPRWWEEDLEELGRRTQLFVLSDELRAFILSLFFSKNELKRLTRYDFEGASLRKKDALVRFLSALFRSLERRKGIHCVMTPNHMYLQNKPLAEGCEAAGVPFIDLHKECVKDEVTAALFIRKMRDVIGVSLPFLGTKICVYNEFMKDMFVGMGVAPPDKIAVTGTLRVDRFRRELQEGADDIRDTVTLFSFRHIPWGANPRDYVNQFSPDGSKGYVRLFQDAHCAWAELAVQNPHVNFVIKLKWYEVWKEQIRKALAARGLELDRIPNLRIVAVEETAQSLIARSIVVAAFNSTTLLEARLAGRPVVFPFFDEAVDTYPDSVGFKSVFDEFLVTRSAAEFKQTVQAAIDAPPPDRPPGDYMMTRYFGFTDGRSLERIMDVIASCRVAKGRRPSPATPRSQPV
jgi:hypothetical protein